MYTSGRTVKSSKAKRSPAVAATATGRRLAKRHLSAGAFPLVSSELCAATDGTVRMKTTISFAECDRISTTVLAKQIAALPGYHSMAWNRVSISYLIEMA